MKILNCPLNGPRNIQEFVYGGELGEMPDPATCSDADWADFIFLEENRKAVIREWWCHAPTNFWFIAERDTASDEVVRTYLASEVYKERRDFAAAVEGGPVESGPAESGPADKKDGGA